MTKIRNTKKGMAKKTLSISLAVAMLATSNVPVWAAEDLFTDGEVAVEAFTDAEEAVVEEVTEETPVIEETVEAPEAQATYTSSLKFTGNTDVTWSNHVVGATDVSVKDAEGNDVAFKWTWKVGDTPETALGEVEKDTTVIENYVTKEADFGKNLYLYLRVVENGNTLWEKSYEAAHIGAVKLDTEHYTFHWYAEDGVTPVFTEKEGNIHCRTYDGTSLPRTAYIVQTNNGNVIREDFNINYPDDMKNAGKFTLKASAKDPKYIGVLEQDFIIKPKEITVADFDNKMYTAKLKDTAKTFLYTGYKPVFNKSDIVFVDTATGDDISALVTKVVADNGGNNPEWGSHKAYVSIANDETVENYIVGAGMELFPSTDEYEIKARDLGDLNFTIKPIEYKAGITGWDVVNAITKVTTKDGTALRLEAVKDKIEVEVPTIGSASATPYTVTVKPSNKVIFTGTATATVRIVERDIDKARITNPDCAEWKKEEQYTGKQIVKDATKLGDEKTGLRLKFDYSDSELVYGRDYTIEYGANVNVKDGGQVIIVGLGQYSGSQKVLNFAIKPAEVTVNDLTAAPYVLYDNEIKKAGEYSEEFNLVVKGHNKYNDEFTLVEGTTADYTVDYSFVTVASDKKTEIAGENKVDHEVKATLKFVENGNFVAKNKATLSKKSKIVKPVLLNEHIQLAKDTYEYTGAPIVPEFKVVVGGKTLVKDKDYTVLNTQDVTEVGDAKVTITGKGNYSDKVKAEASFKVVPADANKVKVTLGACNGEEKHVYDGEAHEPVVASAVLGQNVSVYSQFNVSYGENVNAGKGTVTLTPKKNNKNFTGTKTVEFDIEQAVLSGELTVYNDKNIKVEPSTTVFNYDGSAHTFAKAVFTPSSSLVTANDYEIVYADNVYGKKVIDTAVEQYGHIFVVGKGNFKGALAKNPDNAEFEADGTYVDATGNKITSIAVNKYFTIKQAEIHKNNITVSNGEYREGYASKPNVVVTVGGKTLVEGQDYKLDLHKDTQDVTKVTESQKLKVTIVPINGYKTADKEYPLTFNWGIDKFDFANAEIMVSGTDANPVVKVLNDGIAVDPKNYDLVVADGKATVSAKADAKNYEGSQTVAIKEALVKPETPMIVDVKVDGNKATVVLSGESDGAIGYDYVIGAKDCIETKDYVKVNKNKLTTDTTFTYTQQGQYYAYCHAWTRDENGKKVFSDWSNAFPFMVTAITPAKPAITSVKVKGNTVTVTYKKSANATGYDVVLGTELATISDEKRPVKYGELVKKNINGNTVTATFKNVPAGTYYAGLHAFNRTSEDGKKVFSPWSDAETIKVK